MNQSQPSNGFVLLSLFGLLTILNIVTHHATKREVGKHTLSSVEKIVNDNTPLKKRINKQIDPIQYKCLSLDDMDQMISKFPQAFLAAPPKGGGTSFVDFASACSNTDRFEPFMTRESSEQYLTETFDVPSVAGGHVVDDQTFIPIIDAASTNTLAVYGHRDDLSRLKSAITHVVHARLFAPFRNPFQNPNFIPGNVIYDQMVDMQETTGHKLTFNETHEFLDESMLIHVIKSEWQELSSSTSAILTCRTYESIHRSRPNLIFMNYKQSNKIQELIAKKHCPDLEKATENGVEKPKHHTLVVSDDGSEHYLDDWVDAKINMIQWSLNLIPMDTCSGETKKMEDALSSCPSEMLQVVGFGRVV